MEKRWPDVFVIVLDCVRASDFPGGMEEVTPAPVMDSFRAQATWFPRCVAPASSTVPSHASLLTGLYPHELDCFSTAGNVIPVAIPTVAEVLSDSGYATCLISANHNLRPSLGLTRGFDRAIWGRGGVTALKIGGRDDTPCDTRDRGRTARMRMPVPEESPTGIDDLAIRGWNALQRFPAVLDGVSRLVQAIRSPDGYYDSRAAPWIESTFGAYLSSVPATVPVFTLVNFMDCHEPYLPEADQVSSFRQWWRLVRQRQDIVSWSHGTWEPSNVELRALHDLYRYKIRALDRRIGTILSIIAESRRWQDSLVIVTGDHGQAFGEDGQLFHATSTLDAVARVPLFVKWPEDRWAGQKCDSWTSLVDIPASIFHETSVTFRHRQSGQTLQTLCSSPRDSVVYTMTDALPRLRDGRNGQGCGFTAAAFFGDQRVALGLNANSGYSSAPEEVKRQLQAILTALAREDSPAKSEVSERLRSWGY